MSKLELAIISGCLVFIGVLLFSGYAERDVLVLHLFQSLIYVAVILLTVQRSKWGYAIGCSKALIWNLYNSFSGFVFSAGFKQWSLFLHTGRITRPVSFIAPVAYFDHVLLFFLLAWAYSRLPNKRWRDIWIFLVSLIGVAAYFVLIIGLFWPQFVGRLLRIVR